VKIQWQSTKSAQLPCSGTGTIRTDNFDDIDRRLLSGGLQGTRAHTLFGRALHGSATLMVSTSFLLADVCG